MLQQLLLPFAGDDADLQAGRSGQYLYPQDFDLDNEWLQIYVQSLNEYLSTKWSLVLIRTNCIDSS
jgi:hypothetical protein